MSKENYCIPYFLQDAPKLPNGMYEGTALTKACGKLELLSNMMKKLKEKGHRLLIFSQVIQDLKLETPSVSGHGLLKTCNY